MNSQRMNIRLLQLLALIRTRRNQRRRQLKRPRKFWVNSVYFKRVPDGEFHRIYLPMKQAAEQGDQNALWRLYNYVRMDYVAFMKLLYLLRDR